MKKDSLEKLTDGSRLILHVQDDLYFLARAFDTTGNNTLAEKIGRLADLLGDARKMVDEGSNEAVIDAFEASQQATGNMLAAALAGCLRPADRPQEER